MKTLDDLKRPMFESIKQQDVKDFNMAFNEFDKTFEIINKQNLSKDYLQPWYQVYDRLYEEIISNALVEFYLILLESRNNPINRADKISKEFLKKAIIENFQYLVGHFNEEMLLIYIKHLRKLEIQHSHLNNDLSFIPVSELLMSDVNSEYLSTVFFECQYPPETLIYFFFVAQEQLGKDFFFKQQDRLAMLLHYCEEKIRPDFIRSLAHTTLKEKNPFLYVALLNYLTRVYIVGLRPENLHEEMKLEYKDDKTVMEILNGIEVK